MSWFAPHLDGCTDQEAKTMQIASLLSAELTEAQFNEVSDLIKGLCGINLHDGKKELVKARLTKRLRQLHLGSFGEYLALVRSDPTGSELIAMIDALSTNLTSFFRENEPFAHVVRETIPAIIRDAGPERRLRVWSAGCSSGEEPYSIAITLHENIPDLSLWDAKVLATDISTRMLTAARTGVYSAERIKTISPQLRSRYLECVQTKPDRMFRVNASLRNMVTFGRLNLMENWPMKGPFDIIFCRNVMIYFDKETQGNLVRRFWKLLRPGGTLYVGHSESLTGVEHQFRYVQPTIYRK